MVNKKIKGFTLIELLAVILILGIIALIAIPTVNKVLEEAKINSFKTTLKNIEKKAQETCSKQLITGEGITTTYLVTNGKTSPELELKGQLPDGQIILDNKCNVSYELANNNYLGRKNIGNEEQFVDKCIGSCDISYGFSEDILNGAKPDIEDGLIPVNIENNGIVKKADIYSNWYSYKDKLWANAVLIKNESRDNYSNEEPGAVINQDDIIGYFVWIPRYKYKIPTSGTTTPSTIDIVFENKHTIKSNGNAKTEYFTHPGFTFGDSEINGIWFGKFETTGTTTETTVLPNVTSLRNQDVSTQFASGRSLSTYASSFDSHMTKSTEWITASYLSHSKYGVTNKIRGNNNKDFLTGCGASSEEYINTYECEIPFGSNTYDYPQSLNGNITGIFDMAGGTTERAMGNYNNNLGLSGFDEMPDSKYYDLFKETDYTTRCNNTNCKGHMLYEARSWYGAVSYSSTPSSPWTTHSGNLNFNNYGIFYMSQSSGQLYPSDTFRIALVK